MVAELDKQNWNKKNNNGYNYKYQTIVRTVEEKDYG